MNYFKGVCLCLLMSVLFSCSGDDPDVITQPEEPEEQTVVRGVFIDSEVAGLHYATETQNGITNSEGEYNYIEGETVTFSVGEIILGTAKAEPEMSPVSIASTPNASVETEEVKNIAAFLQTLDSDNDSSNGILIETATVEAININNIDFTQSIIKILGQVVAEANLANDSNLSVIYPETAAEHLASSLGETYIANDPAFNSFIPYLENQYGEELRSNYWIHETDEEGKLIKSFQYEKYPHRLAYEVVYNELNDQGQPIALEEILYNRASGEEVRKRTTQIFYTEAGSIESSISTIPNFYAQGGDYWIQKWYTEFDEEERAVEFEFSRIPDAGPSSRVKNVYDEQGNRIEHFGYSLENSEQTTRIIYTHTAWGDIASERSLDAAGNEKARFEKYYRDDRTLEKQVFTDANGNSNTTLFDENEIRINN